MMPHTDYHTMTDNQTMVEVKPAQDAGLLKTAQTIHRYTSLPLPIADIVIRYADPVAEFVEVLEAALLKINQLNAFTHADRDLKDAHYAGRYHDATLFYLGGFLKSEEGLQALDSVHQSA